MKKKLVSLFAVVASMALIGCTQSGGSESGGGQPSQPSQQTSSGGAASSSSRPSSSSRAPTPSITVASVDVATKEGKTYLQISGTARNFAEADFKWALSLKHIGDSSLDPLETYILGGESFADTDYKTAVKIEENGSFVFEYCLSDVETMAPGMYTITAGPKGRLVDIGSTTNGISAKDGNYRYYFRHDEQVNDTNTLVVDALPPISFEEASIVKIGDIMYAKVGGDVKEGVTQEVLDAYNSFVQFQQVGGNWRNTRRTKDAGQYFYKVEGEKAYLYADVSFFAADTNYNTHINVTENSQADCKMDVALDAHFYYKNANGVLLDINVYANPQAASDDQSEFWGNLGFKVTAAAEGTEEGPITPADPEPEGGEE